MIFENANFLIRFVPLLNDIKCMFGSVLTRIGFSD